jgi:hypothetical protein
MALVAAIKRGLAEAAAETCKFTTKQERSAAMRAFWRGVSPEAKAAWRARVLKPGHDHWQDRMTPEDRVEQRAKIRRGHDAEDVPARARTMWANRSPDERQAVGEKITVGQLRYWEVHPEMRAVRSAAVKAGKAKPAATLKLRRAARAEAREHFSVTPEKKED